MNVHSTAPTDPDAFLRWNEGRAGKRELVRGKVIEMIGATWGHARLVRRLARQLEDRIDGARFELATNDVGVTTRTTVRYPDLLVDRAGNNARSLAAQAPILIVEVLSPSSLATDFVEKTAEYTELPTLDAYLVLAQEEPRAWLWSRTGGVWTKQEFSGSPAQGGQWALIEIAALSLTISLAELYPDAPAG